MRNITPPPHARCVALVALCLAFATPGFGADVALVEDLERERADVLRVQLDPERSAAQRAEHLRVTLPRLAQLERMVVRDDALLGAREPVVQRAFEDYDLTFLAHAAAEQNRTLLDLWLERVGLTTEAVMGAVPGRRP